MKNNILTGLKYWEDASLRNLKSSLIDIVTLENKKIGLVFDQTIFYPQGGGQPSDRGKIVFDDVQIDIDFVYLDTNTNQVVHVFENVDCINFEIGALYEMFIDGYFRDLCTQYHTFSHVLDLYFRLDNQFKLGPFIKGKQFPDESYMTVNGVFLPENLDSFLKEVNDEINNLIDLHLDLEVLIENQNERIFRYTWFEGYEDLRVGCGGTHLTNTRDLKKFEVYSCKSNLKKNTTTFCFKMHD